MSAIHFNENAGRPQACTSGALQWNITYPKGRNWGAVAKPVKTAATFGTYFIINIMLKL